MIWFRIGSFLMFLAVVFGAFGAHALRQRVSPELLSVFETGVRYHAYHALALLALGLFAERSPGSLVNGAGWAFTLGVVVFSGSLYLLTVTGARWLGAITPIGGTALIVGWLLLLVASLR